ncbi:MAG: hypothetical protein PHW53_03690, partial [Patescibacteria group bacterium]|nr:hypothetical protein [Patescibacteria group bacterium]
MERGEQFLHQKFSELHTTEPVEREQERKKRKGEEVSVKPAEKIADFLEVIKKTHGHHEDPRVLERIKKGYHKEYVIAPEDVPESYFELQKRLAREQGHGDIEITDEMKEQLTEVIIADQESTLDNWVDYLSSPDADAYPMWVRYWAFRSMLRLSSYDKEKKAFAKRRKDTVAPFPDLNREALAYVVDAIDKKIQKQDISGAADNPELQALLKGENFGKLYAYAIEKVTPDDKNEFLKTVGEWVRYEQGSDHMPLVQSLQGHGTGWCTAGESTAQDQLQGGDFYVYYSYDKSGKPTIPRVAIRMQENNIAEVRGVAPDQNLDPYIGEVVDKKLKEFPDGEEYKKKTSDMKRLTEIEKRHKDGKELGKDDLGFLYEFKSNIEGFGYERDPRIDEILENRDKKADISLLTGYVKEQISVNNEEGLRGGFKFHYGDIFLFDFESAEGLKLPETVSGNLDLGGLKSAEGLKLPETVSGNLDLGGLISAESLKLPETVGGNIWLGGLISAEGLKLPETVGDTIGLGGLISAEGLKLPETVSGSLDLR